MPRKKVRRPSLIKSDAVLSRTPANTQLAGQARDAKIIRAELYLQSYEAWFKTGHKRVLIDAIAVCADAGLPLPPWVSEAFLNAYKSFPGSWDEMFDSPIPKANTAGYLKSLSGTVKKVRKWQKNQLPVFRRVRELLAEGAKTGDKRSEESVFKTVGKEFGVSGSTAKTMYYDVIALAEQCQRQSRSLAIFKAMADVSKKSGQD